MFQSKIICVKLYVTTISDSSLILGLCIVAILAVFFLVAIYETFFKHRHFFSKTVTPMNQSEIWTTNYKIR